jgi:hypothetical protein
MRPTSQLSRPGGIVSPIAIFQELSSGVYNRRSYVATAKMATLRIHLGRGLRRAIPLSGYR